MALNPARSTAARGVGKRPTLDPREALDSFFQTPWLFYFEDELAELSAILEANGMVEWSRVPKLYFILRGLGSQHLISVFVVNGVSDATIPLRGPSLLSKPIGITEEFATDFEEFQSKVVPQPLSTYEQHLKTYLDPDRDLDKFPLDDVDFQQIGRLLKFCGKNDAATAPKLYYVLHSIGHTEALPKFLSKRYNDMWFPFPSYTLKAPLGHARAARDAFLSVQEDVCSSRWSEDVHLNFSSDDHNFLETQKKLGAGGSGEVSHVYCPSFRKHYAQKLIHRREGLRYFANEVKMLKSVNHRHCVSLICSYTDPDYLAILSRPVADMNLGTLLDAAAIPFDRKQLLYTFFGCLSTGLCYLHSKGIWHKDIKPQNILIHGNNVLFADFGLSANAMSETTSIIGNTPRYNSPEFEDGESRDEKSDVWSLGCVFFEIIAALQGQSIADIKVYFRKRGTHREAFNANPEAVKAWLAQECSEKTLSGFGQMAMIAKGLTSEMLSARDSRPATRALVQRIGSGLDIVSNIYGTCCWDELRQAAERSSSLATTPVFDSAGNFTEEPLQAVESADEPTPKPQDAKNTASKDTDVTTTPVQLSMPKCALQESLPLIELGGNVGLGTDDKRLEEADVEEKLDAAKELAQTAPMPQDGSQKIDNDDDIERMISETEAKEQEAEEREHEEMERMISEMEAKEREAEEQERVFEENRVKQIFASAREKEATGSIDQKIKPAEKQTEEAKDARQAQQLNSTAQPRLPSPASSEDEKIADEELPRDVSCETDVSLPNERTSYLIPDDGSPITIPAKDIGQKSLLIEYFEGNHESSDKSPSRPSVSVKLAPSRGNAESSKSKETGKLYSLTRATPLRDKDGNQNLALRKDEPREQGSPDPGMDTVQSQFSSSTNEAGLVSGVPNAIMQQVLPAKADQLSQAFTAGDDLEVCVVLNDFPQPEELEDGTYDPDFDIMVHKGDIVAVVDKATRSSNGQLRWRCCRKGDALTGNIPPDYLKSQSSLLVPVDADTAPVVDTGPASLVPAVAETTKARRVRDAEKRAGRVENVPAVETDEDTDTKKEIWTGKDPKRKERKHVDDADSRKKSSGRRSPRKVMRERLEREIEEKRRSEQEQTGKPIDEQVLTKKIGEAPQRRSSAINSNASGGSTSLSNNPKLLQQVEDSIRRLILPEIAEIKKKQATNQSQQEDQAPPGLAPKSSTVDESGRERRKKSSKYREPGDAVARDESSLERSKMTSIPRRSSYDSAELTRESISSEQTLAVQDENTAMGGSSEAISSQDLPETRDAEINVPAAQTRTSLIEMQLRLIRAAQVRHEEEVREILSQNIDYRWIEGVTKISREASAPDEIDFEPELRLLLKIGSDTLSRFQSDVRKTAYMLAKENGHERVMQLLVENAGNRIETAGEENESRTDNESIASTESTEELQDGNMLLMDRLLSIAAQDGRVSSVNARLASGANINAKDQQGRTPLIWAVLNGHVDVVHELCDKGADLDSKMQGTNPGWTALHVAAWSGYDNIVRILLSYGAKTIQAADSTEPTALHEATRRGHYRIVKMLLEGGADINAKTGAGHTALDLAKLHKHNILVSYLGFVKNGSSGRNDIESGLQRSALRGSQSRRQRQSPRPSPTQSQSRDVVVRIEAPRQRDRANNSTAQRNPGYDVFYPGYPQIASATNSGGSPRSPAIRGAALESTKKRNRIRDFFLGR